MNLSAVITRVRDNCPAFRSVGGAAEYDVAADGLTAAPAAYIIEESSRAQPNQLLGIVRQDVDVTFGIFLAVRNVKDAAGVNGLADLQTLRDAVWSALAGFIPPGAFRPVEYTGGQLMDFQPGLIWWRESYTTTHTITQ